MKRPHFVCFFIYLFRWSVATKLPLAFPQDFSYFLVLTKSSYLSFQFWDPAFSWCRLPWSNYSSCGWRAQLERTVSERYLFHVRKRNTETGFRFIAWERRMYVYVLLVPLCLLMFVVLLLYFIFFVKRCAHIKRMRKKKCMVK